MNVVLVSRDNELYKVCRELLAGFLPAREWHLSKAAAGDFDGAADLYVWDVQSKADLPYTLEHGASRHIFLVDRDGVGDFPRNLNGSGANILLKPVPRSTLSAFLGLAVSGFAGRPPAAVSLKAERDEILQCLIQTNLKLQEYDQARTNFLARAVHDFRAPLTALTGYCGLLLSQDLGDLNDDQKEVLRRMHHSSTRLSRMASAMFQLSVGRHVKRQPDLRKGDIRECVEQALHELGPLVDGKRITVTVDLDPEPDTLYFEAGQVVQVLTNLLDNASKFTPRAGEIVIRGYPFFWERRVSANHHPHVPERRRHDSAGFNSYRIDIRDTGPLIPPQHLDDIFEEYTSYSGGNDRSSGGLGLAICRMIARLHDGYVWAENSESGPFFSFVLPVYSVRPEAADVAEPQLLREYA